MSLRIDTDLPPVSFDKQVLTAALRLKQSGLAWEPKKGSFVWDPTNAIPVPSPFPNNVYFVLNLKRFLPFFDDSASMARDLVWLPTISQALAVGRLLKIETAMGVLHGDPLTDDPARDCILALYEMIEQTLNRRKSLQTRPHPSGNPKDEVWIREVMHAELGTLDHLPPQAVRQVWAIYREAGHAYLGWRRIQENQPSDWLPQKPVFEPTLLSGLKHFFSDYQDTIRALESSRKLVSQLAKKQTDRHAALLAALSKTHFRQSTIDGVMEQIMGLNMTHSQSVNTPAKGAVR